MRKLTAGLLIFLLVGCSTIKDNIPSFWDDNQSKAVIDIRKSVADLDCTFPHFPQVGEIKHHVDWLILYSQTKDTRDVLRLIKPMHETVDDFYNRSKNKQGSEAYCNMKKKVLETQSKAVAEAVIGRF
jgi:desulfoferrodoxin (superoxide reductase-like protein)